jgi:hypothetical protein
MFKSNYFLIPQNQNHCKNHGIPMGTGKVELLEIEYPKLALGDRKC